jgi:hypothetical protein
MPVPLTFHSNCTKIYDSLADHQNSHPDVQKFKPNALRMAKA